MGTMQQISVPKTVADQLRAKVEKGAYRNEAEVVREALRALSLEEERTERWLRTEVVAAYDSLKARPARVSTAEQVRQRMAERRRTSEA